VRDPSGCGLRFVLDRSPPDSGNSVRVFLFRLPRARVSAESESLSTSITLYAAGFCRMEGFDDEALLLGPLAPPPIAGAGWTVRFLPLVLDEVDDGVIAVMNEDGNVV